MRKPGIFNIVILLLCAMIWGFAFSAQSVGAEHVGPWTFLASRSWIGVATLFVFLWIRRMKEAGGSTGTLPTRISGGDGSYRRVLIKAGAITGVLLALASVVQQAGIAHTSVAKSSFITAMYVVIVPLISLILGRRQHMKIWGAVVISVTGLYLLSFSGGMDAVNKGDLMTLLCALLFSFQIMAVNKYAGMLDGLEFSCVQFLFEALTATAGMLVFEGFHPDSLLPIIGAVLYAGIMSNGLGYTLQIIGQKDFDPAIASLCMCMESVFGALGGWLLLGQTLTLRELAGCALMFAAIIVAEFPGRKQG